jgi:hypothetical protein
MGNDQFELSFYAKILRNTKLPIDIIDQCILPFVPVIWADELVKLYDIIFKRMEKKDFVFGFFYKNADYKSIIPLVPKPYVIARRYNNTTKHYDREGIVIYYYEYERKEFIDAVQKIINFKQKNKYYFELEIEYAHDISIIFTFHVNNRQVKSSHKITKHTYHYNCLCICCSCLPWYCLYDRKVKFDGITEYNSS